MPKPHGFGRLFQAGMMQGANIARFFGAGQWLPVGTVPLAAPQKAAL
jgi:hypothetical protein